MFKKFQRNKHVLSGESATFKWKFEGRPTR